MKPAASCVIGALLQIAPQRWPQHH